MRRKQKRTLRPIYTEPRHRWLATIAQEPQERGHGRVASDCVSLGWSRVLADGREKLTPEGRAVLREWQRENGRLRA